MVKIESTVIADNNPPPENQKQTENIIPEPY